MSTKKAVAAAIAAITRMTDPAITPSSVPPPSFSMFDPVASTEFDDGGGDGGGAT
tara:strand:- start:622 stop:786 length:165 start_codon:yes stop_codon:yes gene_type:complete